MKKAKLLIILLSFLYIPIKTNSQVSKNGFKASPRGTLRVLIVFAELVGTCEDPIGPSPGWDPGFMTGNAPPPNADKYIDFEYIPGVTPLTPITRYYKDISLDEFHLIGDYYPATIQVPCTGMSGNRERDAITVLNSVWPMNADGNYYTAHGVALTEFDQWTDSGSGIPRAPLPDNKIDATLFLWRNAPGTSTCATGTGIGVNMFFGPFVGGKQVDLYGTWDFCPNSLNDPGSYDRFFTIEFMHAIFGHNNFHVGGGAGSGTYMFDGTGAFTTNQGSTSNIVCGWDRNFMDWKGSRVYPISASDISGTEIQSDMSIDVTPNSAYYVLRDFVTIGDAVRIRLPHFNNDVKTVDGAGDLTNYDFTGKKISIYGLKTIN